MLKFLLIYLLIINAVGVVVMLADKRKAQKNLWRIPESTLLTVAVIGGSVGCIYGMYRFHHKTRKPKFYIGFPAILIAQIAIGAMVWFQK